MTQEIARRLIGGVWTTVDGTADGGGSSAIQVLGPFTVNFDDANFVNPNDNGIPTLAIPAGSLLLDVIPITTVDWKATGNVDLDQHDGLYVSVLTAANGQGPGFAIFALGSVVNSAPTIAMVASNIEDAGLNSGSVEAVDWTSQKRPILAVADCHIYVNAGISENGLVAGSLDLYAIIASAA